KPFARSLLRFLGFVFWGTAAALAFGGVSVILVYKTNSCLFQEYFLALPGWLAVAAALTLVPTGVLAVTISVKSSRYRQGALMYLLLVLLCLEVSSAILAQFYAIQVTSELKSTMDYLLYPYNGTQSQGPGIRDVDVIQRKLQCCRVQKYTDWLKAASTSWYLPSEKAHVPETCCKEESSRCRGDLGYTEQLFWEGYLKKLEDWLHFVMLYVSWCCVLLSILELLAGMSNGLLMRHQPFYDFRIL
ncbi:Tetraspanin-3, partial [Merops nubicus]